uniref:USP domain-containing protein n=1 Tax=Oryzias latipes TaxID=8090 RepID=A0A3P9KEM8_ORYLA
MFLSSEGFVQADAAECFEKILRNMTNQEAAQIFQGVLTVKNKCCKCNTETCDDNPCWSLPLELVDSEAEYKVEDGISQYFCPSEVNGPDQLFCGDCNAKTDSTIKLELKHHPEVLTLLLKRFKFDYSNMCYFKVKRRVEIPKYLEIQNQTYELYAFVEHHGNLKSGHYTATIQSQEDKRWYNFNDNRVDSFYQFYQLDKKETFHSAYLLFYRKISAEDALNEENNKGSVSESLETHRSETNKPHKCDEETVKSETNCEMAQSCNSAERREMEKEEEKFISVERDDLKDQTKKSLKKEENLKDQRKMSGKKVEDCEDQTKTSLKKEDDYRGQTKMSLKKEDDYRDQTKMSLKKEDDLRDQTKMSLKKEDDLRDQTKMSLKKEDDLRDQTKMSLKKEDDLRDQTKMSVDKQKDEKNKPEDQAKAAKRLTIYDLYTTSKQSSGRQSEYRARSSERSQEGDKENRRGSTLHEQQSNNKSTESQISPGNQTGRGSIQSSVNREMAEVQREDFKPLVKHFEGLVNDGQGQSREGPSSTSVDYDAGSRKNSCYQQRDNGRDAGNEQRNNVQLPQTGGTTLTNDGCNDDGSGSVQHSGTLYRSSMSVSLQNQSSGKKCDYKEITKRTQNEVILDVLPKRKYNGESDDHQHKHNDERTSERDGRYEATLNRPRSSSEDRKERTNRSNVEKTRESYSSCDRLQHQTEPPKILQQNATSGFINASQHCHVDQNSTEMTPVYTAPPHSDPVSHLTKSVKELTLTDRQTHEDVLTNTPVKKERRGQQILSSNHYESSYNPESPNHGHSCPTYQNSQSHTAYSYPSFSGHNMPVNTDRRGQQMLSNPHRRSHCNPESPNHGHSCPTYPYSQSNIAHSYPSLSGHNMPVNTDHRGQQMLFNTYNWCGYNLVYPIHGSLYPINQNSQGYIASSCPFYSGHITPAENVTAPTGGLVIPTVFDSSIDPMHNISAPPDPVGPQLGSGIRTTTEILRRETQTGSSHENTERGSSESQAQVITEDSADPDVIRSVCGCLCPKTHHF